MNTLKNKTGELTEKATIRKFRIVQKEGKRNVEREINCYNLDAIISVGYRVNSKQATQFRIWATKVLRQHLLQGYTINKKHIAQNYQKFMQAVANVKALLPANNQIRTEDILELVRAFAITWVSLDAYDKNNLPSTGDKKKDIYITSEELTHALAQFKQELIARNQATDIFRQERHRDALESIIGNIFQSAFSQDVYPTIEEKAAHLLYFIVKDYPFVDGNKRSGAFSFVWFLRKTGLLKASLTPEALTALTLLIAESKSQDKDKMIGLILLLLK